MKLLLSIILLFAASTAQSQFTVTVELGSDPFPQKVVKKSGDYLLVFERMHFENYLRTSTETFSDSHKPKLENIQEHITKHFDKNDELLFETDIKSNDQAILSMIICDYFIEYYASGFVKIYYHDAEHPVKEIYVASKDEPGDGHGGGLDTHVTTRISYLTMDDDEIYYYQKVKPKK